MDRWPSSVLARLRRRVLQICPSEATFYKRGFRPGRLETQAHVEKIGRTFVAGYNLALEAANLLDLSSALNSVEPEFRGFAFEGAAMALALLDHLAFGRRRRFREFLYGPGEPHVYMCHVGAGWAFARLPWLRLRLERALNSLDPILGWLAVDGYGFHEGYFHWQSRVTRRKIPRRLKGYALRAFDQGLGRSLWFVNCADCDRISETIAQMEESRRADLWSGIGLACAYAGPCGNAELADLSTAADKFRAALAQGAAFAAKARLRAGNLVPHTERACRVLCGVAACEAADITDCALKNLPRGGPEPPFEVWRRRIQLELATVRR